jgi:glutathione synthase/RimK-type ligase-like ATP-grasp enzyme
VVRPEDLEDLSGLSLAPATFQEFIQKISDIRVTVVASDVFAAEILSQERESSRIDWRATDDPHLVHRIHKLPVNIENLCRKLTTNLGLSFGAIDLVLKPNGSYVFLEINPNGEWVWLEDQLGFPISDRIARWLSID